MVYSAEIGIRDGFKFRVEGSDHSFCGVDTDERVDMWGESVGEETGSGADFKDIESWD
jgi:hypothetical protein